MSRKTERNQLNVPSDPQTLASADTVIIDRLNGIISEKQLRLIECAYEQGFTAQYIEDGYWADAATDFGERYTKPLPRLQAILLNMKANHGLFIPPIRAYGGPDDVESRNSKFALC